MSRPYRLLARASLRTRNTFGVEAHAPMMAEVLDSHCLPDVLALPEMSAGPVMVLGGGSNLLFAGDAEGPVLSFVGHHQLILEQDAERARIRVDAGTPWHALVMWSLERGLCGLENLALIPGTTGAAPIQNIGAYGVEVGEFIHAVEAWDRQDQQWRRLSRHDCAFGYRDSVFKQAPDRYIVTAVEMDLLRQPALRLDYAGIGEELQAMQVEEPTAQDVATAVIHLRQRKLPDPALIGNAGSFFKNPILPLAHVEALQAAHPGLPSFRGDSEGTRKISAAWLIEQAGWKGHRDGDAGVSAAHALVLVNHGQATGLQLLGLARRIAESVQARFGVAIEPEPRIVGARW
ncbi:MAG TPA: UDP-N-acetylmuramate dehydrogenase [Pseudoxanthomonas sp.]|nr:UDP-N-acetylmuramate dehydrogenase [Pseudoxanthomonas sp.]